MTVSFSIFCCSLENGFNRLFIAPNRRIGPRINMSARDEIPWRCRCVIRRENVDDGQLYLHPLRQDGLDVHGYRHVLIVVYANCDMYSPVYMGS